MYENLVDLSRRAHKKALDAGSRLPAEREEWMHLPMTFANEVPVFDGSRMREDQRIELEEQLDHIVGRAVYASTREALAAYMEAYGRFGLRIQDIGEALGIARPTLLPYMKELVAAGKVHVKEEKTRGKGSMRKRYVWTENHVAVGWEGAIDEEQNLRVKNDDWFSDTSPGIIVHGTAICGFRCSCGNCRTALEDVFVGEVVTAARRAGGTGFKEGLALRTARRFAAEAEYGRLLNV